MDDILAAIANGWQRIVDIDRENGRNKLVFCLIYHLTVNPSTTASAKSFCRGSWGWGMFPHKNHAAGEANGFIIVGMCLCCVFS
jgi:hypothetical protein